MAVNSHFEFTIYKTAEKGETGELLRGFDEKGALKLKQDLDEYIGETYITNLAKFSNNTFYLHVTLRNQEKFERAMRFLQRDPRSIVILTVYKIKS